MVFLIFNKIRLLLLVGCDYHDCCNYFCKSKNIISRLSLNIFRMSNYRDNRDDCGFCLYYMDRNNPWGFDEMSFTKHFSKLVSLFLRGP
jgi:hypothetical protein